MSTVQPPIPYAELTQQNASMRSYITDLLNTVTLLEQRDGNHLEAEAEWLQEKTELQDEMSTLAAEITTLKTEKHDALTEQKKKWCEERERRQRAEQERDHWKRRYTQAEQQQETIGGLTLPELKNLWRSKQLNTTQKMALPFFVEAIHNGYEYGEPQPTDAEGRKRVNCGSIATQIGADASTISRLAHFCKTQLPHKFDIDSHPEHVPGVKKPVDRIYAKVKDPDILKHPKDIIPLEPRKQGGDRYADLICNNCNSQHYKVTEKRKATKVFECLECHHTTILDEKEIESVIYVQDFSTDNSPKTKKKQLVFSQNSGENPAPTTHAVPINDNLHAVITSDPPLQAASHPHQDAEDTLSAAAALLLAIAGSHDTHIVMPRTHASKYLEVKRPLALFDLVDHLKAGEARGALCRYQDGSTRALCFDTDEGEEWEAWRRASRKLVQAGYIVIFEESPAGRGGHLWIIFDELVDAVAARVAVLQVAPELADCAEYWPGPQEATSWNRVRLPGGFYARYGRHVERPVKAWCTLVNVATGESSSDGRSAARLLLSSLTPAALVKAEPVITAESVSEIHTQDEQLPVEAVGSEDTVPFTTQDEQTEAPIVESAAPAPLPNSETHDQAADIASGAAAPLPLPKVDARWIADHGPVERTTFWFAITEEYAAAWYNEHHRLEEIRPRERNGMALSPHGNERTASTNYYDTAQGERFTDHSTHGRRSDGTRESGDALELASKVEQRSKSVILSETTREIIRKARAELECAAAVGETIPVWIEAIITPAGCRKFAEWLEKRGNSEQRGTLHRLGTGSDHLPERVRSSIDVSTPVRRDDGDAETNRSRAGEKVSDSLERVRRSRDQSSGDGPGELCENTGANDRNTSEADTVPQTDASIAAATLEESVQTETVTPAPVTIAESALEVDIQDEQDTPVCLVEERKTDLVEGMRVDTPAGLATVRMVRYFENLNMPRWRCAVRTDAVQPDTTRFAVFDVTQVQPVSQRTIFDL